MVSQKIDPVPYSRGRVDSGVRARHGRPARAPPRYGCGEREAGGTAVKARSVQAINSAYRPPPCGPFERYSDQARQVVVLAAGAARTHHQNSVGTEHLLVGILDAGGPGAMTRASPQHRYRRAFDTRPTRSRADPKDGGAAPRAAVSNRRCSSPPTRNAVPPEVTANHGPGRSASTAPCSPSAASTP